MLEFLEVPSFLFSQHIRAGKDSMIPSEVIVRDSGIYAVSKNISDTIIKDVQSGAVLYCYPDGHESFWYKIRIEEDCEVTFKIFPTGAENLYNYFLYKTTEDISPLQIKEKKIAPFRANLCKNEMALAGTGLSIASAVNFYDASSKTQVQDFYYTLYHAPVPAKKGEILILNVYHIKGSDCGYQFALSAKMDGLSLSAENAGKHSQNFQTFYKSCYTELIKKGKYKRSLNLNSVKTASVISKQSPQELKLPELQKAVFVVRDSIKHSPVDAEINFVKHKGVKPLIELKEKGKYEFVIEKNTGYHLLFSAVGYKNAEVFFMTYDSIISFNNNVYMVPYKEGDNFVMEKIYFYANTYSMKPGAVSELNKLITYLKANPGVNIEIQGHTSGNKRIKATKGDKEEGSFTGSAKKLSQCRAETIKKYLMEKGIAGERLIPIGYGGSQMIYTNPKNQAEANKNIRVAIQILSQKDAVLSKSNSALPFSAPSEKGVSSEPGGAPK